MHQYDSTGTSKHSCSDCSGGFTMIELLIAVAIMLVFASGMFLRDDNFNSTAHLNSLAQDVALTVRQAQTFGGSGQQAGGIDQPYGVSISSAPTAEIILYADSNTNNPNGYDGGDRLIERRQLPESFQISGVCLISSGSDISCGSKYANHVKNQLDIYFQRPSLASNFQADGSDRAPQRAVLEIEHVENGTVRQVIIDATGYVVTEG